MELTDENLRTLSDYLQKTLSPDPEVRRPSEKFLESVEGNKNYAMLLLHLVNKPDVDMTIRVAGAITFKNFVKRNWPYEEESGVNRIHAQDRENVKLLIVDIMLVVPAPVQKQLSDAVSIIGRSDFPGRWPTLLPHMVEKFATGDFHVINGVLHTAHSLFKRYRFEFKSQLLWTEIKFVLDSFAKPVTDLLVATHNLTSAHASSPQALKTIYNSLLLICKIFYSLNYQDLPEFFEDNMSVWMPLFHRMLVDRVECLESADEEIGVMEELRSQIVFDVGLYAQKYDEEFQPFLPNFVTDVWELLVTTGAQAKYDLLVSNALQFLSTVANRPHYRHLFADPAVLTNICEKVIIPNIQFRQVDEELFEDNPEEYMRRDIEGSDVETRRRAACDLVKVLGQHYEERITSIFSQYILGMLGQYNANNAGEWRSKNTAVYLVTSLAGKGQTQKQGVTVASALVPLNDFYAQHIAPELDKDVSSLPVIKADALKYILMFRSVLPPDMVVGSLPRLVRHLSAPSQVVHSYAATTIERVLTIRRDGQLLVKPEVLAPLAGQLLPSLFNCLDIRGSEENEYVMKAIMRSFSTLQDSVVPYLSQLLPKLTEKLAAVSRNPSKPHFNHYLFETITLSIRIVCKKTPGAVSSFEEALFPIFQVILQQDVQEFLPYVLQVLSMLLGLHARIPDQYLGLYPCLLAPLLWERCGNVKPLTALLRAFIAKATARHVDETLKINGLLGVFQKLISSRANDHEGFHLIQSMMEYLPKEILEPFMKQVFLLLFQRLSSSKTTKFIKGVLVFFCFYVNVYGAEPFVAIVDSIQPQMFGMIVERLFAPDTQKICGTVERKITAVGLIKMLKEGKLLESSYAHHWGTLLRVVVNLFELPEDVSVHVEDHFVEVDDAPGYEVAYAQLSFADKTDYDPFKGIGDTRTYLANTLSEMCTSRPTLVPTMKHAIAQSLSPLELNYLKNYLDRANVSLPP